MPSRERFLELLLPHRAALEGYARRCLRDGNDVEDALQAAVTTAWRTLDRFADGTNFRAWIFRILAHEILNRNRHRERRTGLEIVAEPEAADFAESLARESVYERLLADPSALEDHFDGEVVRALDRLNAGERHVFLLRAVGEFAYRDIAAILDIPIGSVMGHLFRARAKLREALCDYARREGLHPGFRPERRSP